MGVVTGIAWTKSTFNPWMGCTKVSAECKNCYAETERVCRIKGVKWGEQENRRVMADSYWRDPFNWNRKARLLGEPWRVFCGSLCDFLDSRAPEGQFERLFETIRATPYLTWLLLTKREQNFHLLPKPLPSNVWLGVTAGDQEMLEKRVAELPKVDAAVRFVSYEPALSPLDRSRVPEGSVHWLICGCESGPNRRRMQLEWALDVKEQCISRGISFFMKQMEVGGKETDKLMDFPIELQTREYPTVASVAPDGVEPGREAE